MGKNIRTFIGLAGGLIAVGSGWYMWSLNNAEQLWGRLPLIFFTAMWSVLMLFFTRKWKANRERNGWLVLSIISGVLLTLSFPTFPTTFLIFFAFVPLLLIEQSVANQPQSGRKVMFYAYNAFVMWNILVTYWVANTAFFAGIVAIWLNAFFMALPFWFFHKTKKYTPRLGYASLIVYWISFEYLHLNWEISWPWLNLGNAFAQYPSWVQWYEYTGTFGGTLWVLLANVLIFKALEVRDLKFNGSVFNFELSTLNPKRLLLPAALIILPIIFSLVRYSTFVEKGDATEVVVVQPNFEPHYKKFTVSDAIQLRRFLQLADSMITPETKYLLFPETSFGLVEISDPPKNKDSYANNREIKTIRGFLEKHPQVVLITGVDSYYEFEAKDPPTKNMRTYKGRKGTVRYEIYNGAFQIKQGSIEVDHYKKSKFVPGAEIFPYSKILFFFEPIVKSLGGSVAGLGTQPQRSVFEHEGMKIAPSICYESIYGEYNNGYIKKGAQAIFIMTNDGWWDETEGYRQHMYLARLRAVETRKSIARSTNQGGSAFINQRGDVFQSTDYNIATAIRGEVLLNNEITFYVIYGDMIARLGLFTALLFLANLFVKWRMQRKD